MTATAMTTTAWPDAVERQPLVAETDPHGWWDTAPATPREIEDALALSIIVQRVRYATRQCIQQPDDATITWMVDETLTQLKHELRNAGYLALPGIGTLAYDAEGALTCSNTGCIIDPEDCA